MLRIEGAACRPEVVTVSPTEVFREIRTALEVVTMSRTEVSFDTDPGRYRHLTLEFDGEIARIVLRVDEDGGLVPGYELKLNSYDLGVDIELYDAVQRLRFEHPEVRAVVVTGGLEKVFCAGANIRMLA